MSMILRAQQIDVIQRQLRTMNQRADKVVERTIKDAKARVPGWIATEVAKEYAVSKKDITGQKIGTLRVEGSTAAGLRFVYRGRVLTPTHFKMSPTAPNGGSYTLKATIIKGQRTTLGKIKKLTKKQRAALGKNFKRAGSRNSDHSPIMLMGTGNAQAGGTDFIPFQRKSTSRSDVEAIKTVSLPQMISNDRVSPGISRAIDEKLGARIEHHLQQLTR